LPSGAVVALSAPADQLDLLVPVAIGAASIGAISFVASLAFALGARANARANAAWCARFDDLSDGDDQRREVLVLFPELARNCPAWRDAAKRLGVDLTPKSASVPAPTTEEVPMLTADPDADDDLPVFSEAPAPPPTPAKKRKTTRRIPPPPPTSE
jgi:hypothetical protein